MTTQLHTTTCITLYTPITSHLMLQMILPCTVSLPWPGRESHATPGCASPAVGLMEMSACSWNTHFDVMNCSGVHTLPKCQITACIPQCDTWTQRYWKEGWNISGTLVSIQGEVSCSKCFGTHPSDVISKLMVEVPQHLTSSDMVTLLNNNTKIYTVKFHNDHIYNDLDWYSP